MQLLSNYLLIDAARAQQPQIAIAKEINTLHISLYKDSSVKDLAQIGPYLFVWEQNSEFASCYSSNGWGNAWGMIVQSTSTFDEVYKHFRKFLLVKTEDGHELYFRFYDPRVLRIFLPTCDEQQLKGFFGPISYYVMEDEDPEFALRFQLKDNKLQIKRLSKEEWWTGLNTQSLIEEKEDVQTKIGNSNQGWGWFNWLKH